MDFDEREPEKKNECGHVRERVQFWPSLFAAVAPHSFFGSSSCAPRGKEQLNREQSCVFVLCNRI